MQVLPEQMRPVDLEHPSRGLDTVTQYIHYMRERIEFAHKNLKNGEGGGIEEAPADGRTYGRKDGGWAEVETGGGTTDYTDLTNKPKINGHTLTGNQTAANLGLLATGANISSLNNDAGYITEDVKIQGVVNASETLVFSYTTSSVN